MRLKAINETLNWVWIGSDSGRSYNKPIVNIDGEECFDFKGEYHKVSDYEDENTRHVRMTCDDDE